MDARGAVGRTHPGAAALEPLPHGEGELAPPGPAALPGRPGDPPEDGPGPQGPPSEPGPRPLLALLPARRAGHPGDGGAPLPAPGGQPGLLLPSPAGGPAGRPALREAERGRGHPEGLLLRRGEEVRERQGVHGPGGEGDRGAEEGAEGGEGAAIGARPAEREGMGHYLCHLGLDRASSEEEGRQSHHRHY